MSLIVWLRNLWWARQRKIDLMCLWPACVRQARDLDHARAAFAVHAFNDPAWIGYYGHAKLVEVIGDMS